MEETTEMLSMSRPLPSTVIVGVPARKYISKKKKSIAFEIDVTSPCSLYFYSSGTWSVKRENWRGIKLSKISVH